MSSKTEPAIWSRDTGQRNSCYDSCQLNIIGMFNIKDICCNPRLHDLILAGWPPCCATSFVVVDVRARNPRLLRDKSRRSGLMTATNRIIIDV